MIRAKKMTSHFEAIFENGVLRPLEALDIPDQARVRVTVEAVEKDIETAELLAKQKAALKELWEEMDKLPQHTNNDGWSARDHDQLLYGGDSQK